MIRRDVKNWRKWRGEEKGEEAKEEELSDEELEQKLENIDLTRTLARTENEQKVMDRQRTEEEELGTALEQEERRQEEEEERIAMEFIETGTEICLDCAHDPCLCSLVKLEMRMQMLGELKAKEQNQREEENQPIKERRKRQVSD